MRLLKILAAPDSSQGVGWDGEKLSDRAIHAPPLERRSALVDKYPTTGPIGTQELIATSGVHMGHVSRRSSASFPHLRLALPPGRSRYSFVSLASTGDLR